MKCFIPIKLIQLLVVIDVIKPIAYEFVRFIMKKRGARLRESYT